MSQTGNTVSAPGEPLYRTVVGEALPELDQRLSDELARFNADATRGVAPSRELTVQILDTNGALAAGISGWTWGVAARISLTWVRAISRGDGLGSRLLAEFESAASTRGCTHMFVTSFTFQAPGFYERHGYREIFRWEGVPTDGAAVVHFPQGPLSWSRPLGRARCPGLESESVGVRSLWVSAGHGAGRLGSASATAR